MITTLHSRNSGAVTMIALAAVSVGAACAGGQISFDPAQSIAAGVDPDTVAAGDFDGDLDQDLAVTSDTPDKVSILLNNGDGTFAAPVMIPTGAGTGAGYVVAVNLDGDGDLDLAVALKGIDSVRVYFNNGAGTFSAGGTFAVGLEPVDIAVGDFDGVLGPDLAVVNRSADSVSILLNGGGGAFGAAVDVPVSVDPRGITAGNFDGDADVDLAVTNHDSSSVSILANNGSGSFSLFGTLSTGAVVRPDGITSGDLNGDGDVDLAVATSGGGLNTVSIYSNDGTGVFSGPVNFPVGGLNPGSIAAADLDCDGDLDLLTANRDSNDVSALHNNGAATFGPAGTFAVGLQPDHVAVADLDGDAAPDAVTADQDAGTISLLFNSSADCLAVCGDGPCDAGEDPCNCPQDCGPADMNEIPNVTCTNGVDDDCDVLVDCQDPDCAADPSCMGFCGDGTCDAGEDVCNCATDCGAPPASELPGATCTDGIDNDCDGPSDCADTDCAGEPVCIGITFEAAATIPAGSNPDTVAAGDFDGDQVDDLAVTSDAPDQISILLNNGDGTFAAPGVILTGAGTGAGYVVAVNLDGDGDLDLAVALKGIDSVRVYFNNGVGTFSAGGTFAVGLEPVDITVGDFDGVLGPDLAVVNRSADSVSILLNGGGGAFGPAVDVPVGVDPRGITAGNFDGDGDVDLAVTNHDSSSVSILANNGSGSFSLFDTLSTGAVRPDGITSGDLNGDGDVDLALATSGGGLNTVSVYSNDGAGIFSGPVNFPVGGLNPGSIAAADLDCDGDLDVLTANRDSNDVSALPNNGDATFGTANIFAVGLLPDHVAVANLDGDPAPDAVTVNQDGGTLSVLLNATAGCAAGSCVDLADCADIDGNGIRDDNCVWWACEIGVCVGTDVPFADMGGANGACAPDLTADANDRFHVLNCFSDQDTLGKFEYPCEADPPQAFNVDAGGANLSCFPDGVCDANDAFAALNAFDGSSTCSCPSGPMPEYGGPAGPADQVAVRLVASGRRLAPGGRIEIDVFFDRPLDDLRGYQLHVGVSGGQAGRLALRDMAIAERKDHVFAGMPFWSAFNIHSAQMAVGLDGLGVATPATGYLATLSLQASSDAVGTFVVDLLYDPDDSAERTFIFTTPGSGRIEVGSTAAAIIEVRPASETADDIERWSGHFTDLEASSMGTTKRNVAAVFAAVVMSGTAAGQTITVDTSADVADFGGAQMVGDLPGPDGKVSLKEAGLASDNTPGVQTIAFNVPEEDWEFQWLYPGRVVLTPFLGFRVFDTAIIDATTQTSYSGNTNPDGCEVVIWNTSSGDDVFVIDNVGGEVRGLDSSDIVVSGGSDNTIQRNTSTNISVFGSSFNLIGGTGPGEGNAGGTIKIDRASDNVIVGNTVQRVRVLGFGSAQLASNNRIGGPNPEDRNYITGYGTWNSEGLPGGTTVQLFDSVGTIVENNWIGTTPDGLAQGSLASVVGIGFEGENNDTVIRDNRIAGILGHGQGPHHAGQLFGWAILVAGNGSGVTIVGNTIGLDANDDAVLGSVWGIDVGNVITSPADISSIHIGGLLPGEGNVIAGHLLNGITIGHDVPQVLISGTSVYDNGWLGIDLIPSGYGYGVTPNDPLDVDTGGNGLQNHPEIGSAVMEGTELHVAGTLHSSPFSNLTIEFFASPECDDSGFGEGQVFLGSSAVATDESGDADFDVLLAATVQDGWMLTSTATLDPIGATSEFSACVALLATTSCVTTVDCADPGGSGVRSDGCMWWSCEAGTCVGNAVVFADMGGEFGACEPDNVVDANDRFHALNCFSDTDTLGNPGYLCEAAPPFAYNVDAGGPFGACLPDGVCDGNDAFHALNAFAEASTCSCPMDGGGPAPDALPSAPRSREYTSLRLTPERDVIGPGERVAVEVTFDRSLNDVRGYQLHSVVRGGDRGNLRIVDMFVEKRKDNVFTGLPNWQAFNLRTMQLVVGLDDAGVPTKADGYLATLIFEVDRDAAGTFIVDVLYDTADAAQRTFLFASPTNGSIDIAGTTPAVIEVTTALRNKRVPRR